MKANERVNANCSSNLTVWVCMSERVMPSSDNFKRQSQMNCVGVHE